MRNVVIRAEARLRARSQLTLPEPIVAASAAAEGDRFVVEVTPDDPDTIRLVRIRDSYAGTLRDVYDEPVEYLAKERSSWDRR
jgi:bifunctional DNA-binding transcriptional regulator/antitoxin component of YhaV-PrlF toxin-antitoxin module